MAKITALKVQKRNPNRVNVYLDGEFSFGLARVVAAWLQVGQELNEAKIAQLRAKDEREVAYQRALRFISHRSRSEAEVRQKLKHAQVKAEVIQSVLHRLRKAGLVDDLDFARSWVENRNTFRPRGRHLLTQELRRKGISEEIIQQVLDGLDEEQLAYQAALKGSRRLKNLEWPEFRRKLYAHLARRGFSYEHISPVVERVWAERHQERPTVK